MLSCKFNLVFIGLEMNLKKTKVTCVPKVKKTLTVKNYQLSSSEKVFTFTMKIPKKGKISLSNVKIVDIETSISTTTPSSTTPIISVNTTLQEECSFGYSKVCSPILGENCPQKLQLFCPTDNQENSSKRESKTFQCGCRTYFCLS